MSIRSKPTRPVTASLLQAAPIPQTSPLSVAADRAGMDIAFPIAMTCIVLVAIDLRRGGRQVGRIGEHEVVLGELRLRPAFQQHRAALPADADAGGRVLESQVLPAKVAQRQMVEHPRAGCEVANDVVPTGRVHGEGVGPGPADQGVIAHAAI